MLPALRESEHSIRISREAANAFVMGYLVHKNPFLAFDSHCHAVAREYYTDEPLATIATDVERFEQGLPPYMRDATDFDRGLLHHVYGGGAERIEGGIPLDSGLRYLGITPYIQSDVQFELQQVTRTVPITVQGKDSGLRMADIIPQPTGFVNPTSVIVPGCVRDISPFVFFAEDPQLSQQLGLDANISELTHAFAGAIVAFERHLRLELPGKQGTARRQPGKIIGFSELLEQVAQHPHETPKELLDNYRYGEKMPTYASILQSKLKRAQEAFIPCLNKTSVAASEHASIVTEYLDGWLQFHRFSEEIKKNIRVAVYTIASMWPVQLVRAVAFDSYLLPASIALQGDRQR